MRKFLVLVVILAFAFPLQAQIPFFWSAVNWRALGHLMQQMSELQSRGADFREAIWGMTQAQIKALEKGKVEAAIHDPTTGLDIIGYKGAAGGLSCNFAFYFAEDQLVRGRYVFTEKHSSNNTFIVDFSRVKASLTEKYGEPVEDDTHWFNDLFKDDFSSWGMAIAVGHLWLEAHWVTFETQIMLQLRGDNYEFTHVLEYSSTIEEHEKLVKKTADKAKKGIW